MASSGETGDLGELLEKGWFFGNSLDGKQDKLLMCCSAHHCCSYGAPETLFAKSFDGTFASIVKLGKSSGATLLTTTSNPLESNEPSLKLLRPPSLPTVMEAGDEVLDDEENEFSMVKLIAQASKSDLDAFSPKGWGFTPHQSIIRGSFVRMKSPSQLRPQMNSNHTKVEQVEGSFRELGLLYVDGKESGQKVVIPDLNRDKRRKRNTTSPPASLVRLGEYGQAATKWSHQRSTKEMKMKIKSWARAVAGNVRREC